MVTTNLLCKWPKKSYFIQISSFPSLCSQRWNSDQTHYKINKLNTLQASSAASAALHRTAPVQTQPEDVPKSTRSTSSTESLPSLVSTREFLVSGRKLPKPSLDLHFKQQQWPLGSVLVASAPLSSRRGWHRSHRNQQLEKEVHGNSWWVFDPISSPSGSGIKLYQNHPQVHPSQSFPQPHPACLSFIDKKTKKKKRFP